MTKDELQQAVDTIPHWFHSLQLPHGIVTKGDKHPDLLSKELATLRLPDLTGKRVLDIGAWDGYYSFEAERRGAESVLSLDHFVWTLNRTLSDALVEEWQRSGAPTIPFEETSAWQPDQLPGKRGYELAQRALESKVTSHVADFMHVDPAAIGGPFDVVFFLGVLYHIKKPMHALEQLARLTKEVAIIETAAVEIPARANEAFCQFFERDELNDDFTNWWAPNMKALVGMCRAAGFSRVDVIQAAPSGMQAQPAYSVKDKLWRTGNFLLREFKLRPEPANQTPELINYRAIIHAWK